MNDCKDQGSWPVRRSQQLAGHFLQVTAEQAHSGLRNLVYDIWSQGHCEEHVDIIRMLGSIDFFLPYFPLEGSNIRELFVNRLVDQRAAVLRSDAANVTWSNDVTDFLMSKVWAGRRLPCQSMHGLLWSTMHS